MDTKTTELGSKWEFAVRVFFTFIAQKVTYARMDRARVRRKDVSIDRLPS
jgi:hypothetical protein